MKKTIPLDNQGVAHLVLLLATGVIVVIGGVGIMIAKSHHSTKASQSTGLSQSTDQQKQLTVKTENPSSNTITIPAGTQPAATVPTSTGTKTGTTKPSAPAASSPTQSSSTPVVSSGDTYQEELSALTAVIEGLNNGGSASITTSAVTVAGPITNAQARPIIFGVKGGDTYFAYTQGTAPNFNQSASALASSMAIVSATGSYGTESAHLNKSGQLVDENSTNYEVGYSVGGN